MRPTAVIIIAAFFTLAASCRPAGPAVIDQSANTSIPENANLGNPLNTNIVNTDVTVPVKIFLIDIGDNGANGPVVGCGDSVVAVERTVPYQENSLRSALEILLAEPIQNSDTDGHYNAFTQSDLVVEDARIVEGTALINLTGTYSVGGACDEPRIAAQILETASAMPAVHRVEAKINGQDLAELASGRGE